MITARYSFAFGTLILVMNTRGSSGSQYSSAVAALASALAFREQSFKWRSKRVVDEKLERKKVEYRLWELSHLTIPA
ncbi:hypothetical protein B0J12DRAFT_659299 [Macrophomina phaseolina]|uniref:Secreted protein n=1 Tax=Macrophomina phaseolina TaxID=35725 RepID=A0ABQ8GE88_9PEZI|nr:hypothetical protein B0J12DRAFT_659299 [Macrophomina phaseolina]